MKILTVRQPWSEAIIFGGKDVENRSSNLAGSYRGPVLIHSGLYKPSAAEWLAFTKQFPDAMTRMMHEVPWAQEEFGVIIGVVDIVSVHKWTYTDGILDETGPHPSAGCSRWAIPDGWHLQLSNPRALDEPIPWKGTLGLRDAPFEATDTALYQHAGTCTCGPGPSLASRIGHEPGCGLELVARLTSTS